MKKTMKMRNIDGNRMCQRTKHWHYRHHRQPPSSSTLSKTMANRNQNSKQTIPVRFTNVDIGCNCNWMCVTVLRVTCTRINSLKHKWLVNGVYCDDDDVAVACVIRWNKRNNCLFCCIVSGCKRAISISRKIPMSSSKAHIHGASFVHSALTSGPPYGALYDSVQCTPDDLDLLRARTRGNQRRAASH